MERQEEFVSGSRRTKVKEKEREPTVESFDHEILRPKVFGVERRVHDGE